MDIRRILQALADLAPAGEERIYDVTRGGRTLVWLAERERAPRSSTVDKLAAQDALHRDERILRRGTAFVVGTFEVDGVRRKVRLPLLTQPVRLERTLLGYRVTPIGDLELTGLVEDRRTAAGLEAAPGLDSAGWSTALGTHAWMNAAAKAAGLPLAATFFGAPERIDDSSLNAYAASALYVTRDVGSTGIRDTLLAWAARAGLADTALARVYAGTAAERPSTVDEPVLSPLPLNTAQREVVRRVRREPVVVVSGPPGNGKSHALVAAALDVVDRGGSVLVATQSVHAAEVLGELLRRHPGPVPVLFGDAERRDAIATELAKGTEAGADAARVRALDGDLDRARRTVAGLEREIGRLLELERRAAELPRRQPLIPGLATDAPAVFAPDFDLDAARALLDAALGISHGTATGAGAVSGTGGASGFGTGDAAGGGPVGRWQRWRRRRALRRVRRHFGAADDVPPEVLEDAWEAAASAQAAARLAAEGPTDLPWRALADADETLARTLGEAMRVRATSGRRRDGAALRAASALGTALRAGRNRRREILAGLDGAALVRALPLWVGTAGDVDDLLPPVPGMFDLVVLDEAAHIDQLRAAPVLARARHALVAGDPRQLRFVSFVADVDIDGTLRKHGLEDAADRLDVRRSSAFDVAAGAAGVTWLAEHHRCAPHLIEFSARRFYTDRMELVTRTPRNDRTPAISVVRVAGSVADGVNAAEVSAAVEVVRAHLGGPIAVITPFRAQSDAVEAALLAAFTVEEIEKFGIRSGTVHGFQGSEAEHVVVSLGLVDGDSPARRRFVTDANLFNVMVTRARARLTVVTSLTSPNGLIGDYLAHASAPPVPPPDGAATGWTARLADELRRVGGAVRVGYPVGRWNVDIVLDGVALTCGVHPSGVAAHVERERTLRRAGWEVRDAFPSRWGGDAVRAALSLVSPAPSPGSAAAAQDRHE
ncbi:hypothetical protein Val02_60520 [Virgisporangium aliadipatigenens]|uniref:DNA2/NAM7 helicase-like C-terminal domain-containing protein n=1 Tax=Virgisporangium aliadipatigenens TaxID=741659 RepID=A0A8J4DTE1_9ACTN|nr:DEAD/DEAH box helicase [Virgisporangium aliadipatigenens]GIJ49166.1 hypothetical protein Val02_60520 [Virgisporangium aliadipatigenens]